jgi:hypothetical protein
MTRSARTGARFAIAACLGAIVSTSALNAQVRPETPRNWNYEVDQRGNRVPRSNRITRPDGSWREELRQGNCVTIKERSATGEYKETRECNPGEPRNPG